MGKWNFGNFKLYILLLLMFFFAGMAIFSVWVTRSHNLPPDKSSRGDIGGVGCPHGPRFEIALYDRYGSRQEFEQTSSTYVGAAPLYEPDKAYPAFDGLPPCSYPVSLPADVVKDWSKVYPLIMEVQVPQISAGESKNLEVTIWMDTEFSGHQFGKVFPVIVQPGGQINVSISLYAPNFDIRPDLASPHVIQIDQPITRRWSIAPVGSAVGEQSINVEIHGLKIASTEDIPFTTIELNVQPQFLSTIKSLLLGLGLALPSSLIALIIALYIVAKHGLEFYKTWQDVHRARTDVKLTPKGKPKSKKPRSHG